MCWLLLSSAEGNRASRMSHGLPSLNLPRANIRQLLGRAVVQSVLRGLVGGILQVSFQNFLVEVTFVVGLVDFCSLTASALGFFFRAN